MTTPTILQREQIAINAMLQELTDQRNMASDRCAQMRSELSVVVAERDFYKAEYEKLLASSEKAEEVQETE